MLKYRQRIFDVGLDDYVVYESDVPTATPQGAITTPPGTGTYTSTTHVITEVYDDYTATTGGGGGGGGNVFVIDTGATVSSNVFHTWQDMYNAVSVLPEGPKTIITRQDLTIPNGTFLVNNWSIGCLQDAECTYSSSASTVLSFSSLTIDNATLLATTPTPPISVTGGGKIIELRGDASIYGSAGNRLISGDATGALTLRLYNATSVGTDVSHHSPILLNGCPMTVEMYDQSGFWDYSVESTNIASSLAVVWYSPSIDVVNNGRTQTNFTAGTGTVDIAVASSSIKWGSTTVNDALNTLFYSNPTKFITPICVNAPVDVLGTEITVGHFILGPTATTQVLFEAVFRGKATGNFLIYEVGKTDGAMYTVFDQVLRATVPISDTFTNSRKYFNATLTPSTFPGTNVAQIWALGCIYELRVNLATGTDTDYAVLWAGITSTQYPTAPVTVPYTIAHGGGGG